MSENNSKIVYLNKIPRKVKFRDMEEIIRERARKRNEKIKAFRSKVNRIIGKEEVDQENI